MKIPLCFTYVRVIITPQIIVDLEFKLQDMWIGLYWNNNKYVFDAWICIVPMFPIHFRVLKSIEI